MTIFDFISFDLDRTEKSLAFRVHANDFDVPVTFSGEGTALATSGTVFEFRNKDVFASTPTVYGFKFRCKDAYDHTFFHLLNDVSDSVVWLSTKKYDDTSYELQIKAGQFPNLVVWTSPFKLRNDVYHFIEISATSGILDDGEVMIRIDGFLISTIAGITLGVTANPIDGCKFTLAGDPLVPTSYEEVDSLWIADEWLGPKDFDFSYPIGVGRYSGWNVVGAGINSEAVDDAKEGDIDDDTSYVETSVLAADTYKMKTISMQGRITSSNLEAIMKDSIPSTKDFLKYDVEGNILSSIAEVNITETTYAKYQDIVTPSDFDKGTLDNTEIGQGDIVDNLNDPANVIIFLVDDPTLDAYQIYDSINPYTGTDDPANAISQIYIQSPALDSAASEGVTFTNAYANSVCTPSRASLLTGLFSHNHNLGSVVGPVGCNVNTNDPAYCEFGDYGHHPTLAHILKANNIAPVIVGKYHFAMDSNDDTIPATGYQGSGWDHITNVLGFDIYSVAFRNLNQTPYPVGQPFFTGNYYQWTKKHYGKGLIDYTYANQGDTPPPENYATTVQIDDLIEFAGTLPEPFCIYVALNAIHGPFNKAPDALVSTPEYILPGAGELWENSQGMLEAVDSEIARFLAQYDAGRKSRTTFMFIGDNGSDPAVLQDLESKRDVGTTYEALNLDTELGGRYKHGVYDRSGRVPFVVWGNKVLNGGRESKSLVHICDVFSTVLQLQNLSVPQFGLDGVEIDSKSFLPILRDAVDHVNHDRQELVIERYLPNGYLPNVFYDEWDVGTPYLVGKKIWYKNDMEYECLVDHTGEEPSSNNTDSTYWKYLGKKYRGHGYYSTIVGGSLQEGLYSLVVLFGQPDELYKLKDSSWNDVDPYQLAPLAYGSGDAYELEYLEMHTRYLIMVEGSAPVNTSDNGLPLFTADGGTAIILREETGEFKILDSLEVDADILAPNPDYLDIIDPDGNTDQIELIEE